MTNAERSLSMLRGRERRRTEAAALKRARTFRYRGAIALCERKGKPLPFFAVAGPREGIGMFFEI